VQKIRLKSWALLFFWLLAFATVSTVGESGNGPLNSRPQSQIDVLREKGSEALFNLDYEAARQIFKELTRSSPRDPIGPQMQALTIWLQVLNNSRVRQGAIYSTQSFDARSEDKPDPRVTQDFRVTHG
jgi:hypothetical protein